MRELKFRVWTLNKKHYTTFDLINRKTSMSPLFTEFVDAKYVIQQYTGLKDKRDVDIYEGDILAYEYENGFGAMVDKGVVEYQSPQFWLRGKADIKNVWKRDYDNLQLDLWQQNLGRTQYDSRVIGNIFETPELLK